MKRTDEKRVSVSLGLVKRFMIKCACAISNSHRYVFFYIYDTMHNEGRRFSGRLRREAHQRSQKTIVFISPGISVCPTMKTEYSVICNFLKLITLSVDLHGSIRR